MRSRRLIAAGALGAAALAVFAVVVGGGGGHELRARFSSAVNLVPGAEVRAGGVRVGKVRSIEVAGGGAELRLAIDGAGVWPLHEGTRARIRLGGTVSYANRYVELVPGRGSGRPLPDGAELPAADTTSPVEFDEVFNLFDGRTRAGVGALVDRGAATIGPRGTELRRALSAAGAGLGESGATFAALGGDAETLRTLVRAGAATARELAGRDAELRDLVDAGATTFSAVAARSADVRQTLVRLPVALSSARHTLAGVHRSLAGVDGLVGDIAPGARELRRAAAPLREAVATLKQVAPDLERTLATVQRRGPTAARFLDEAAPFARRLAPVLESAAPIAACVRAYTPELLGFVSTWAALATVYDADGRQAQINAQSLPFSDAERSTSAQVASRFPQLRYALLRPPGLNAGSPWMVSDCGATDEIMDVAKDPESR